MGPHTLTSAMPEWRGSGHGDHFGGSEIGATLQQAPIRRAPTSGVNSILGHSQSKWMAKYRAGSVSRFELTGTIRYYAVEKPHRVRTTPCA